MFVLMTMQGFPISANLPDDLGFGERFWYWRGASGTPYIHSIYAHDSCPRVAGAVFVVVETSNGTRSPVAVGKFPRVEPRVDYCRESTLWKREAGFEVHVHLLARDDASADAVWQDLCDALNGDHVSSQVSRLSEPTQLSVLAG